MQQANIFRLDKERDKELREAWRERGNDRREAERHWLKGQREAQREYERTGATGTFLTRLDTVFVPVFVPVLNRAAVAR